MERTNEENIAIGVCFVILLAHALQVRRRNQRPKKIWIRPWIRRRQQNGAHHALLEELSHEDEPEYRNFVRMSKEDFEDLLQRVTPYIKRSDTHLREAISPAERLSITLRFLATGDSYKSLKFLYRIPSSTLSYIIPETCQAIYAALKEDYLKVQSTETEWYRVAKEFKNRWNFPNCVGAMDGKHIPIKCPLKSGSNYYNYKHFFSIVLLAIVDADYKFLYVDVGKNGRISDGGVFANSSIYEALESNGLNIPQKTKISTDFEMPYVIVGDDAFPLKTYLMKPYPSRDLDMQKRIFNYRLSRARRISENAFGILTSRFGIFKKAIELEPEKVEKIVLATCALHNFLRTKLNSRNLYMPTSAVDQENIDTNQITAGEWRNSSNNTHSLSQQGSNFTSTDERQIRDRLCEYFLDEGEVPWQWNIV